jgi:hypothetical protein
MNITIRSRAPANTIMPTTANRTRTYSSPRRSRARRGSASRSARTVRPPAGTRSSRRCGTRPRRSCRRGRSRTDPRSSRWPRGREPESAHGEPRHGRSTTAAARALLEHVQEQYEHGPHRQDYLRQEHHYVVRWETKGLLAFATQSLGLVVVGDCRRLGASATAAAASPPATVSIEPACSAPSGTASANSCARPSRSVPSATPRALEERLRIHAHPQHPATSGISTTISRRDRSGSRSFSGLSSALKKMLCTIGSM